jgi:cytochrome c-type biogenesis protein CcsB
MAALSDNMLVVTILAYLVAMVAYAAEFSFGNRGTVARAALRQAADERELVSAATARLGGLSDPARLGGLSDPARLGGLSDLARPGGAGRAEGSTAVVEPVGPVDRPPAAAGDGRRARLAGRLGVALTVVGAAAHVTTFSTRGLAAHRVPWGNMYEFVLAIGLVGVIAFLVLVNRRPEARPLGLFVTLLLVVLLGFAGMRLYAKAGPLVPALNSNWLKIHVTTISLATGILLVGFVAACLTLLRYRYDAGRRGFPFILAERLPAAERLERMTFRIHTFAFPVLTLGIMFGAIWAEAAWGRYWGWDPKEVWSFITWVVYAGYLHARATPSVRRPIATGLAALGWVVLMFNLYGVNLVFSGLHSYAGVK